MEGVIIYVKLHSHGMYYLFFRSKYFKISISLIFYFCSIHKVQILRKFLFQTNWKISVENWVILSTLCRTQLFSSNSVRTLDIAKCFVTLNDFEKCVTYNQTPLSTQTDPTFLSLKGSESDQTKLRLM